MRLITKLISASLIAVAAAGCATPPPPPPPPVAHHPAYLKAMSDLRASRWLIEHHPSDYQQTVDETQAVAQIDAAIGDLRQAAYDDGKNPNDRPPIDDVPDHRGRLREALEHLGRARAEISREEDNGYAQGLRGRAVGHIDGAINAVHRAQGS